MQFKHTLGLQDFMNRTENQEQRRAEESKAKEERKRGKWDSAEGEGEKKKLELVKRRSDNVGKKREKKEAKGTEECQTWFVNSIA